MNNNENFRNGIKSKELKRNNRTIKHRIDLETNKFELLNSRTRSAVSNENAGEER